MEPFDLIRISGYCYSHDRFFYRQPAVVASVGPLYGPCIKVWMVQIPDDCGKFWFDLRFARVTVCDTPFRP